MICAKCGSDERYRVRPKRPNGECKNCHRLREQKRRKTPEGEATRLAYCAANAERIREYAKERAKKYPDRHAEQSRRDHERHKEKRCEARRAHYRKNPQLYVLKATMREERIRVRTPPWADIDAIRAVYAEAARLTKETGTIYHVDHIIPLNGKICSGLHVHTNLQILEASENLKKSNKLACGHTENADLNAARNIKLRAEADLCNPALSSQTVPLAA